MARRDPIAGAALCWLLAFRFREPVFLHPWLPWIVIDGTQVGTSSHERDPATRTRPGQLNPKQMVRLFSAGPHDEAIDQVIDNVKMVIKGRPNRVHSLMG